MPDPADRPPLDLLTRSDAAGLSRLGGHLALLMLFGAASTQSAPLLLGYAVLLVFLFAPAHECVHRTAFASRWLNDGVAFACGLVLLLPPRWFRAFHLAHHRHTQDPARDPEIESPRPASRRALLWHLSGVPYWVAQARTLFDWAFGEPLPSYVARSERAAVARQARLFLAIYSLLAVAALLVDGVAYWLLWLWCLPALLGQPFLRAFLLAEHAGCPHRGHLLERTRTTRTAAALRWLSWNMSWHGEHHLAPAVPFHQLPAFARRTQQHAPRTVARGYARFNTGYWRSLSK